MVRDLPAFAFWFSAGLNYSPSFPAMGAIPSPFEVIAHSGAIRLMASGTELKCPERNDGMYRVAREANGPTMRLSSIIVSHAIVYSATSGKVGISVSSR